MKQNSLLFFIVMIAMEKSMLVGGAAKALVLITCWGFATLLHTNHQLQVGVSQSVSELRRKYDSTLANHLRKQLCRLTLRGSKKPPRRKDRKNLPKRPGGSGRNLPMRSGNSRKPLRRITPQNVA